MLAKVLRKPLTGSAMLYRARFVGVASLQWSTTPTITSTIVRFISTTPITLLKEGDVKAEFYVAKAERKNAAIFQIDHKMGETRLERNDRRCPTRELNFSPETWGKHKSPWRRLRHMVNIFRSSAFQRLAFPDLAGVSLVALGVTYYNSVFVGGDVESMLTMSAAGFGGATTAIGLLAGFRLNAAYGRYEECRIFWVRQSILV
jgi:hypothetical protein